MSTKVWTPAKATTLALIAAASVVAAIGLQFASASPIDWRDAPTSTLLLLLALQFLPLGTVVALMAERRRARRAVPAQG